MAKHNLRGGGAGGGKRERARAKVRAVPFVQNLNDRKHTLSRTLSRARSLSVFLRPCLSLSFSAAPPLPPPHFLIVRFRQKLNQRKEELEAAFRAAKREHEQDREDDAKERDYKDLREKLWTNGHRITLASNLYVRVLLCAFLFPDSVPGRLDELRLYWRINLCIS